MSPLSSSSSSWFRHMAMRFRLAAIAWLIPGFILAAPPLPGLDDRIVAATSALNATRGSADPARHALTEQRINQLAALAPEAGRVLALRAWQKMTRHRFDEALTLASEALSRDSGDQLALALRTDALTELGRYDEAMDAAQTLLDRAPNLISYPRAAHLRLIHGDLPGAIELAAKALTQAQPGNANVRWLARELAYLKAIDKDYEGALSLVRATVGSDAEDHAMRGRILLAAGDPAGARRAWQLAYELVPQAEYILPLWRLASNDGDRTFARRLERLLEAQSRLDAADGLSNRIFVEYFALVGKTDQAIRQARGEYARRPDIYSNAQLAWVLNRNGETEEASIRASLARRSGCQDPALLHWLDGIPSREAITQQKSPIALAREARP